MTTERQRWVRGVERILGEEGPASSDPDRPPPQVGRYRVLREIGRGGAAVVYEAEDVELKRRVALKILRDADMDATVLARLQREAAIVAGLFHPNIVGVHEIGTARDATGRALHFIAMDFVEGRTLADLLRDRSAPLRELLRILEKVARAAAFAHSRGIVHRDLKPGNVLVETGGRVILTDFGLAVAESFGTRITRSHAVLGTPQYMAPEQVEGRAREIDARTDVYALGVILYEILEGRLPFPGETAAVVYRKILTEDPLAPGARPDLEAVCLKALEKEPGRRYASAEAFADELGRYLRGEPVEARRPSALRRLWRRMARRKGWVAAAAGALIALAAGAWLVGAWRAEARGKAEKERDLVAARARELASRAVASLVKGDLEDAVAKAGQAVQLDPENAPAYIIRADARLAQLKPDGPGRPRGMARPGKEALDEIIRDYSEAVRIDRRLAEAYAKRGAARLEKGDTEGAVLDASEALRLDPRWVEAYYVRGRARSRGRDAGASAVDFAAAIELSPSFFKGDAERKNQAAEAFYHRARLRSSAGDLEGTASDCRIALDHAPQRWSRRPETEALLQRATQGKQER